MPEATIRESSPAREGMNCERLCKMLNYIKGSPLGVHSLLILRNGHKVMDMNFHPFHREVPYYLDFCTASVVSALVGIALEEGLIGSINDKVIEYFPEYEGALDDPLKHDITLEHLLKMATGLEWDELNNFFENNYNGRMHDSEDPVGFILGQPMREEPGKRCNQCVGAPHLLSTILQKASGMRTSAYAEEKLFKPLGITRTEWFGDRKGVDSGSTGLSMTPEGLAKIGQLYLQKGKWEGVQIIPEKWINLSTQRHMEMPAGPWSFYGIGYLWNMTRFGGYSAKGAFGQYMAVIPNLNMVAVIIAAVPLDQFYWPETIMETFIIPAARFSPANQSSLQYEKKLRGLLDEISGPPGPKPVSPLPEMSSRISGRKYVFNSSQRIKEILLYFHDNCTCTLKIGLENGEVDVSVGLDGVYRVSGNDAYKGYWQSDDSFVVKNLNLGMNYETELKFTFTNDMLYYEEIFPWGIEKYEGVIKR